MYIYPIAIRVGNYIDCLLIAYYLLRKKGAGGGCFIGSLSSKRHPARLSYSKEHHNKLHWQQAVINLSLSLYLYIYIYMYI